MTRLSVDLIYELRTTLIQEQRGTQENNAETEGAGKFSRFTAKLASMKEVNYALEQRHANLLEIQAREYDHATRGRSKR